MAWDMTDYAAAGALVGSVVIGYGVASRGARSLSHHIAVASGLFGALALVWINLAVGIIGEPDNPANLVFLAVLATGAIGAIWVRFRPDGMMRVMLCVAVVQAGSGLVTIMLETGNQGASWPGGLVLFNLTFSLVWLLSAGLFHRAAQRLEPL